MATAPRRRYRELTCALCALVAALAASWAGAPVTADGPLLDLLVWARSVAAPPRGAPEAAAVAVIALDRRSLEAPELAPYPRAFFAPVWTAVLDSLAAAGTRAVAFDFLFAYSANRFQPDFDAPFLAALARHRSRVVLARSAATLPAPPFLAALHDDAEALGLAELSADPDGRYRGVRASYETTEGDALPSLAGALLRRAGGPPMPSAVVLAPERHPETIPTYALIDVLRCATPSPAAMAKAFAGKIVLIGTTLPEEDRRVSSSRFLSPPRTDAAPLHPCGLRRLGASAPDSTGLPAVFLHAAAVDAVLRGRVTSTAPEASVVGLTASTAAIGAAAGLTLTPGLAAAATLGSGALLFAGATTALAAQRWVPIALPLGALLIAPWVAYVVRYLTEERARRRIQHAFSHYLSPTLVDRLAQDASVLKLGGERREVTVMFADLSGFTALSSKVEPEALTRLLNRYLGFIVEEVETTGGYVDKFIGDAVMALWGVPVEDSRHAVNGVRAAIAAVARICREREAAEARGEAGFSVRMGLNSGPAVVGNVGTERRYNYTAIGETVNVAARLEKVPDAYACQIVVGPRTAELVRDEFLMRELDLVRVRGLDAPLAVFEPLGARSRATPQQLEHVRRGAEALAHYRARRFTDASAIWDALARAEWGAQQSAPPPNAASRMADRARALAAKPPSRLWDGAWPVTGGE